MTSTALDISHNGDTALAIQPGQISWDATQLAALAQIGLQDASDGDRSVFLHVCQRTGLDPFARQIYMIARNEKVPGTNQWRKKWTIQTGIDGFRVNRDRAERKAGVRGILGRALFYDHEGKEHRVWFAPRPPVACEITYTVRDRDGNETPYTSVLRFTEYAQVNGDGNLIAQWKDKPAHMLEKCFHGKTRVQTDQGSLLIRDIVNKRMPVKVRSIDLATGQECWQPVVNWWRNGPAAEWVRIWAPTGRRGNKPLRVTPNHHVWTPSGWREAGDLLPGDPVAVPTPILSAEQEQVILGSLLGDGHLGCRKRASSLPHFTEAHSAAQRDYLVCKTAALASLGVTRWTRMQSDGAGGRHETEFMRTRALPSLYRYRGMKPEDRLAELGDLGFAVWFMDDGSFQGTGHGSSGVASRIFCCGFSAEFADAAVAWLEARHGISAKVLRRSRNPYIVIGTEGTRRLETVLSPWMHREGTRKCWDGGSIRQGRDGFAFVPILATERIVKAEAEQRYDIEVAGTHTLIAGGLVVSNCTEADVYRKAFPQDFSGIYLDDAMLAQDAPAPAGRQRGRVTAGEIISSVAAEPDAASDEAAEEEVPPPPKATSGMLTLIGRALGKLGVEDENRLGILEKLTGHDLAEPGDLTQDEARAVKVVLDQCGDRAALIELLATGALPGAEQDGDGDG